LPAPVARLLCFGDCDRIKYMTTITIPKKITKGEELIIIPRKEYEGFLRYRLKEYEELTLTPFQKRRLQKARGNLAKGKYLTIHELKSKLGIKN